MPELTLYLHPGLIGVMGLLAVFLAIKSLIELIP